MRGSDSTRLSYQANYDQIARDHIREWRETGANPFQSRGILKANEDATVALVLKHMSSDPLILDAGCGMGDLMLRFSDYAIEGIDISEDYIAIAHQRGLVARKARIEKIPRPRETFDMVIATDVLEHVLDLNRVVKELLRVLKPGGVIIARTPNEEALTYDTAPYEFVHLRRFDEATFRLLFGKIFGCEVLEVSVSGDIIHAVARK